MKRASAGGCSFRASMTRASAGGCTSHSVAGADAVREVAVGDRHAPVPPKCTRRDLDSGGALASLVLTGVDKADHPPHDPGLVAGGDQLLEAAVVLDVGLEDRIQHLVG